MFSHEFDRTRFPLSGRIAGIVLGSILLVTATASLVSAKTVAFSFWAVAAAFFIAAGLRRELDLRLPRTGPVSLYLGAFLLLAFLSTLWARDTVIPLDKACAAWLIAASSVVMVSLIEQERRLNLLHMGEGLVIGLGAGLCYLLVELLTDQSIKLALYRALLLRPGDLEPQRYFEWHGSYLAGISKEDLTRNITAAPLLLWPVVMVIQAALERPWRTLGSIGLIMLTVLVVVLSRHESSKLALVIGLAAFAISLFSLRWIWRLAAAAWVVACLAVVPMALLAHRFDLHHAPWLQASARDRIMIWSYTAEKTLESPWLGIGADMTYVLGPEQEKQTPAIRRKAGTGTLNIHAHNVYLQTWFELGIVGAALLTLFGLSLLNAIRTLSAALQPYAYATFTSCAAMASTSFGMWQLWFMALFGFCAVAFAVGARLHDPGAVAVAARR